MFVFLSKGMPHKRVDAYRAVDLQYGKSLLYSYIQYIDLVWQSALSHGREFDSTYSRGKAMCLTPTQVGHVRSAFLCSGGRRDEGGIVKDEGGRQVRA